jgi:enoyl-CoA hydratase
MSIDYALGDDHVVTITINRPEARNSMDMEHFFQLRSAWDRFGEDDHAYVAIITGVGKDFCVGADLKTYIPQITELQSKLKEGGRPEELGGYRLDDGVKAVLRGSKLYKPIIDQVSAQRAYEMGLVNEVCRPADLMERAYDYAHRITANGPLAVRKTKESALRGLATDMKEAFRIESEISGEVFSSEDAKEGPKAFAEKRTPNWQNR